MTTKTLSRSLPLALVTLAALSIGCTQTTEAPDESAPTTTAASEASATHEHGAWWCGEHGVPEEVCARCDSKLAAEFQRKGDWCDEHERPDSQCFVCHPELESRFAGQYVAKYGEQPPKPEE